MEPIVATAVIVASVAVTVAALCAIAVFGYLAYLIKRTGDTMRSAHRSVRELSGEVTTVVREAVRFVPKFLSGSRRSRRS